MPDRTLLELKSPVARRGFLAGTGLVSLGFFSSRLFAASGGPLAGLRPRRSPQRDVDIQNFALNFEYLGAELYFRALGEENGLAGDTDGVGTPGEVIGGHAVPFEDELVRGFAEELAFDERGHVRFLRGALGDAAIARPAIDLENSFTAAARMAGIIGDGETFDAFADDTSFLLAAFMLEDVCVTALRGAAPLLLGREVIAAAGRLLGTEGYHGGMIRTALYARRDEMATPALTVAEVVQKLSDLRDTADGDGDLDQGIVDGDDGEQSNVVPTDANGLAFARTPRQVLNIAYLSPGEPTKGGFFPNGVNGRIS